MTRINHAPTRLVLVRHGETVHNQRKVWTGWNETPLNEAGRDQVRRTAAWLGAHTLGATALYSSPIGRALETAQAIARATGLNVVTDAALKEMHFGELEAINSDEFPTAYPQVYARWKNRTDESFGWPGGETRAGFRGRVAEGITHLADAHPGETILVATHSGFIRMALAHFAPQEFTEWWKVPIENCSLTHMVLGPDGQVQVPLVNYLAHLA